MIGVLIMESSSRDLTWLGATLTGGEEALDLSRGASRGPHRCTLAPPPLLPLFLLSFLLLCLSLAPFNVGSSSFFFLALLVLSSRSIILLFQLLLPLVLLYSLSAHLPPSRIPFFLWFHSYPPPFIFPYHTPHSLPPLSWPPLPVGGGGCSPCGWQGPRGTLI